MTSKWRISDVRLGLWQKATLPRHHLPLSREKVRIALMIATLNDLKVKLGNILNAYVQAPVT